MIFCRKKNINLINFFKNSQILFWDTRSKASNVKKKENEIPLSGPETFKHLSPWKPILKVSLPCSDPGGDFAPTKFSIAEKQGDKSASNNSNHNFYYQIFKHNF